jgi:hypothetical protein
VAAAATLSFLLIVPEAGWLAALCCPTKKGTTRALEPEDERSAFNLDQSSSLATTQHGMVIRAGLIRHADSLQSKSRSLASWLVDRSIGLACPDSEGLTRQDG